MHLTYPTECGPNVAPLSAGADEAGAPGTEVEITPAMIEAGLGPLLRYHRECSDEAEVVTEIFRAMVAASG